MSRMSRSGNFQAIAAIRAVQHRVAEVATARAIDTVGVLADEAKAIGEELEQSRQGFRAYVARSSFNPQVNLGWMDHVQKQLTSLANNNSNHEAATAEAEEAMASLRVATSDLELATDLVKRGERSARRLRDEKLLADLSDVLLQRSITR